MLVVMVLYNALSKRITEGKIHKPHMLLTPYYSIAAHQRITHFYRTNGK
jgi:hypothetical protein